MRRSLSLVLTKQTDDHVLHGFSCNHALTRRLKSRALVYLNEIDRRKLYAKMGYSSLFRFLTEKHTMSESTALKQIQVARLARKFPFLYKDIEKGIYSLSVLSRISGFVNNAIAPRLFSAVAGKSVRETEIILVKFFPKADVQEMLQKTVSHLGEDRVKVQFMTNTAFLGDLEKAKALLSHRYPQGKLKDILGFAMKTLLHDLERGKKSSPHIPRGILAAFDSQASNEASKAKEAPGARADSIPRGMYVSTSETRDLPESRSANPIHIPTGIFASTSETRDLPESRSANPIHIPRGMYEPISETEILWNPSTKLSRYIPQKTQDAVWWRDDSKCQHLRPDGTLCGETRFLEIDHILPFALGGGHETENLRLLCWAHNAFRAELQFGKRPRSVK